MIVYLKNATDKINRSVPQFFNYTKTINSRLLISLFIRPLNPEEIEAAAAAKILADELVSASSY